MASIPGVMNTNLLLTFFVLLLPLGQLTTIPLFGSGIGLYVQDLVLLTLTLFWAGKRYRTKPLNIPPLVPAIFFFNGIVILSLLLAFLRFVPYEIGIGSLYLVRFLLYSFLYWIVYDGADEKYVVPLLALSGVIAAIFGLVQYIFYPNLRNIMYLGWDPHEYRVFGTFFDSNFLGGYLVLTLILIHSLLIKGYGKTTRFLLSTSFVVSLIALLLTYSRSSYLAFVGSFSVISFLRKKFFLYGGIVLIFIVCLVILPQRPLTNETGSLASPGEGVKLTRISTIVARANNYLNTLAIIKDNVWFGIGFNMLRYENRNRGYVPPNEWEENHAGAGSDSSLLFVFATTGITGLISYLFIFTQSAKLEVLHNYHSRLYILPTIVALGIHSLFLNSLFYPWCMAWLWMLLGVSHRTGHFRFVPGTVFRNYFNNIFSWIQGKGSFKRTIG